MSDFARIGACVHTCVLDGKRPKDPDEHVQWHRRAVCRFVGGRRIDPLPESATIRDYYTITADISRRRI